VKRYRFPLASVLRIRRVEEDQAIAALAEAERRRAVAAEALARREAALRAAREAEPTVSNLDGFLAARERQARSASALTDAEQHLAEARTAITARRAAVAAASAAVTALEHLDERRREEHQLEVLREETIEVDDLVTGRHRRGHR
jgi:flagellar export protein FliJ